MAASWGKKIGNAALTPTGMKIIVGSAVLLGVWYMYRKAKAEIATSLNPASSENLVNVGFSKIGQDITGNPNWSLDETLSRMFTSDAEKQFNASLNTPPNKGANP